MQHLALHTATCVLYITFSCQRLMTSQRECRFYWWSQGEVDNFICVFCTCILCDKHAIFVPCRTSIFHCHFCATLRSRGLLQSKDRKDPLYDFRFYKERSRFWEWSRTMKNISFIPNLIVRESSHNSLSNSSSNALSYTFYCPLRITSKSQCTAVPFVKEVLKSVCTAALHSNKNFHVGSIFYRNWIQQTTPQNSTRYSLNCNC